MAEPLTTIRDLVARIEELDEGDLYSVGPALYARPPWEPGSEAVVLREEVVESQQRPGFRLLMEVFIAKEVLDVWSGWRDGRRPTADEAAAAVIYYAENDAYEPLGSGE